MGYYVIITDRNPREEDCEIFDRQQFQSLREAKHYAISSVKWYGFASIYRTEDDECIDEFVA